MRERLVAHRQDFVDEQDLGVGVDCHREAQAHVHAGGVVLHRLLEEVREAGELDDALVAGGDLALRQPEHGAVDEDVLAPRDLRVEAGPELDQRGDAAGGLEAAGGRLEDAGDQLEQGRLARAVAADDAERLAARDLERDVLDRGDGLVPRQGLVAAAAQEGALQGAQLEAARRPAIALADVRRAHRPGHSASTSVSRRRSKIQQPTSQATSATAPISSQSASGGKRPAKSASW